MKIAFLVKDCKLRVQKVIKTYRNSGTNVPEIYYSRRQITLHVRHHLMDRNPRYKNLYRNQLVT